MHLRFITGRGRCDLLRDARVYHPTRHPDPERSEGEGPHSLHVIPTPVGGGTSCNVHAKHELPPALRYACAVRDDGRTKF
jgi:hypothetical protein